MRLDRGAWAAALGPARRLVASMAAAEAAAAADAAAVTTAAPAVNVLLALARGALGKLLLCLDNLADDQAGGAVIRGEVSGGGGGSSGGDWALALQDHAWSSSSPPPPPGVPPPDRPLVLRAAVKQLSLAVRYENNKLCLGWLSLCRAVVKLHVSCFTAPLCACGSVTSGDDPHTACDNRRYRLRDRFSLLR